MAEDTEKEDVDAVEGEDGEGGGKKKLAGKTLILFIVLPAFLVLGGGAAAFMMMSGGDKDAVETAAAESYADEAEKPKKDEEKAEKKEKDEKKGKDDGYGDDKDQAEAPKRDTGRVQVGGAGDPSYYIMPDLLVNLASNDNGRPLFLKLKLTLESVDPQAFDDIPDLLPRIIDQFQLFLRELRVDDLNGSAGGYRLRLELLRRLNIAIAPKQVDAVLIEEMLVQ